MEQIVKSFCVRLSVCLSVCLSAVCPPSHGPISWSIFTKSGRKVKTWKMRMSSLGSILHHSFPYHAPKTVPKGVQMGISQPNYQNHNNRNVSVTSDRIIMPLTRKIQPVKWTSWLVRNWRITNTRWQTAAILEIHKQVYPSQFLADLHQVWCAASHWRYEGYWSPQNSIRRKSKMA